MSHHIPISDVLVAINDPRQQGKIRHDLVETLVVAICGVLAGADTFIEIDSGLSSGWTGSAVF